MEELEQSEHVLGGIWHYVSTNLSIRSDDKSDHQRLTFSNEEEQVLEEKVSEAMVAYRCALTNAQDWIGELQDIKEAKKAAQKLEKHNSNAQSHMARCRKALVAYRQRAKIERLEKQRQRLLPPNLREASPSSNSSMSGLAVDVTAALKRTRQVMSQEIERASSVTTVLDDGRQSLRSSHNEYGNVSAEIVEVRKRLKVLESQAKQDKIWIGAGFMVLISTVMFIVYERTGFILI